MNIEKLYQQAVEHQQSHDCSAHPYENGEKLIEAIQKYQPREILEIGTGIGYTASIMAQAAPQSHITTLEKDQDHFNTAKAFIDKNGLSAQVTVLNEQAELWLPQTQKQFDFIFFDGFQIHYEFMRQYERILKPKGILFLGNNHLKSRTSDMFFEELNDPTSWKILEQFAETTVSEKI